MASLEGVKVGDVLRVRIHPGMTYSRSVIVTRVTRCYVFTKGGERFPISDGKSAFYVAERDVAEREATNENA